MGMGMWEGNDRDDAKTDKLWFGREDITKRANSGGTLD